MTTGAGAGGRAADGARLSWPTLLSFGSVSMPVAMLALGLFMFLPKVYSASSGIDMGDVGLIIFAMLLFFLEMQAPGIGIFGIGGVFSLVVGLFFLFGNFSGGPEIPEPGTQVSPWVSGSFIGAAGVATIEKTLRPT